MLPLATHPDDDHDGAAPWVGSLRPTGGPNRKVAKEPLWQSKRYPEEDAPNPFQNKGNSTNVVTPDVP